MLKEIRKSKGLTQKQLAEQVGLRHATICQYEKKQRKPNVLVLAKIAKALGVSTDTVLDCFIEKE